MITYDVHLKYPKERYTDCGFFDDDMDPGYIEKSEKLVKCRKSHICTGGMHNCRKQIHSGEYALRSAALFPGEGWKSCYVCIPCIEEWLDDLEGLS